MAELKVEQWPIDRLIPYARNPRRNDEQVDRMASAIREFGFRIPIVAKSDGSLVDGHLRLKAAQKLGLKEVPVALADELTDAQVKAFRILANKSANWAEWDTDLLRVEFEELKELDFDLEMTGFELPEIDEILAEDGQDGQEEGGEYPIQHLADKFGFPPFSVLNARDGVWRERKQNWIRAGVDSGDGRREDMIAGGGLQLLALKMTNIDKYRSRLNGQKNIRQ